MTSETRTTQRGLKSQIRFLLAEFIVRGFCHHEKIQGRACFRRRRGTALSYQTTYPCEGQKNSQTLCRAHWHDRNSLELATRKPSQDIRMGYSISSPPDVSIYLVCRGQ